jgi:hypothetical protein
VDLSEWTVVLAVLALGLGFFNSYWSHFRIKRTFYFLRIAEFSAGMRREFPLVYGGNRDVLISSVLCCF